MVQTCFKKDENDRVKNAWIMKWKANQRKPRALLWKKTVGLGGCCGLY